MELQIEKDKAVKMLDSCITELFSPSLNPSVWLTSTTNVVRAIFPIGDARVTQISSVKFHSQFQKNYKAVGIRQAEGLLSSFIADIENFGKDPSNKAEVDSFWQQRYNSLNEEFSEYKVSTKQLVDKAENMLAAFDRKITEVDKLNAEVASKNTKITALEDEVDKLKRETIQWDNLTFKELFSKLSILKWIAVFIFLSSVFTFGFWVNDMTSKSAEKRLEEENESYKKQIVDLSSRLDSIKTETKQLEEENKINKKQVVSNADSSR